MTDKSFHTSNAFEYVLFDLDGTISESGPGITRCAQYALHEMGVEEPDLVKLERFVGPPLNVSFRKYYGFSAEESVEAVRIFQERYDRIGVFENAIYPGVEDMLRELRNAGLHLAIASSKPKHLIPIVLGQFGIADCFEVIAAPGFEQELTNKMNSDNKQFMVQMALEQLGVIPADDPQPLSGCSSSAGETTVPAGPDSTAPGNAEKEKDSRQKNAGDLRSRCAMVGDRFYDIRGAIANHVTAIGVTYGYGTREELEEAGADIIADSAGELCAILLGR